MPRRTPHVPAQDTTRAKKIITNMVIKACCVDKCELVHRRWIQFFRFDVLMFDIDQQSYIQHSCQRKFLSGSADIILLLLQLFTELTVAGSRKCHWCDTDICVFSTISHSHVHLCKYAVSPPPSPVLRRDRRKAPLLHSRSQSPIWMDLLYTHISASYVVTRQC